jgi:hypothetical protein
MNSVIRLENIIQDKKWTKNDIGMGRIQCGKLIQNKEDLILIIAPVMPPGPIYARVKKILLVNNVLKVFYDGENCEKLNIGEFDQYKSFLTEDEWNVIYDMDIIKKLELMNMISKREIFEMDVYENIYNYKKDINKRENSILSKHIICMN